MIVSELKYKAKVTKIEIQYTMMTVNFATCIDKCSFLFIILTI